MEKMIMEEIKRRLTKDQVQKLWLLDVVAGVCDCTTKDVAKVYSDMKKEGLVYSVNGMPGFVGMHQEGEE